MQSDSPKRYLNWTNIEEAVSSLAVSIESHHCSFDRILAVARGGLIPAAMLSHRLGIKEVGSLQLESYVGANREKLRMYAPLLPKAAGINNLQMWGAFAAKWDNPKTLIVDDLYDTGETARWVREMFPDMVIATLYWKNPVSGSQLRPAIGFPGKELPNEWIVFPWERDDVLG